MVNSNFKNKHQWNLKQNSYIFILENAFQNVICEMAANLYQPQCGNAERHTSSITNRSYISLALSLQYVETLISFLKIQWRNIHDNVYKHLYLLCNPITLIWKQIRMFLNDGNTKLGNAMTFPMCCFYNLGRYINLQLNTLRPRQDGHHFPDDTFKSIFLNENV